MLYADGKVITPLFRAQPGDKRVDKRTGEVHYPRAEHDAALHVEGTGEMVWGTKFVLIAARHPYRHGRFIVDVAHVPTPGGEAATAVDRFVDLAPLLPGAQGVVYDTALRGVHHQRLMRDLGWLSVNRVSAAAGSRQQGNGKNRKRIEKTTWVETKTVSVVLPISINAANPIGLPFLREFRFPGAGCGEAVARVRDRDGRRR